MLSRQHARLLSDRLSDVSVRHLAARCGWSRSMVGEWKKCTRAPTRDQLVDVLTAVGASSEEVRTWVARHDGGGDGSARKARETIVGPVPEAVSPWQHRPEIARQVHSVLDRPAHAVLVGNGGMGKTQLAAAVFRRRASDADVAVWVDARSTDQIVEVYAEAARVLGVGSPADDRAHAADAFLTWLETTDRPWVVALDDVEDAAAVAPFWPGGAGTVLATTRLQDVVTAGDGRVRLSVDVFASAEARDFVTDAVETCVDDCALQLADELGRMPLALSQAVAVVRSSGLSCQEVLERLRAPGASIDAALSGPEADLAATWAMAMERAVDLSPHGAAAPVLELLAYLDSDGVDEALVTGPPARRFVASRVGVDEISADDARRALRALHRLSLVQHQAGSSRIRTHALVQRVVRESLTPEQAREAARATADALMELSDRHLYSGSAASYVASCQQLMVIAPEAMWDPEPHPILARSEIHELVLGRTDTLRPRFEHVLREGERRGVSDHPVMWMARCSLLTMPGETPSFSTLSEFAQAAEERWGRDHIVTVHARATAVCVQYTDLYPLSELQPLFEACERQFGADSRIATQVHWRVVAAMASEGEHARALDMAGRRYARLKAREGRSSLAVIEARYHLVDYAQSLGTSMACLVSVAEAAEKAGMSGYSVESLGDIQRMCDVGVREYTALSQWADDVLGPEHLLAMVLGNNVGALMLTARRHADAVAWLSQRLEQTKYPDDHTEVGTMRRNLLEGIALVSRDIEDAFALKRLSQEIADLGAESLVWRLRRQIRVGLVRAQCGEPEQGLAEMDAALAEYAREFPTDAVQYLQYQINRGVVLAMLGRTDEAAQAWDPSFEAMLPRYVGAADAFVEAMERYPL